MIDLHTHTNYSDGTDSIQEILEKAEEKHLDILSITDHDSTEAYPEIIKNRHLFSGTIIPGVEVKAFYDGIPVEVLGYGIDPSKIKINRQKVFDMQIDCLEDYKQRARKLGLKFDENLEISRTDTRKMYASFAMADELLKHKENEEILLSLGPMFTPTEFYRIHSSNKKSIFYYDESKFGITIEEAIDLIHSAGGLAFFAHPLLYPYDKEKFTSIEEIIQKYNLDGLEVEYPLFTEEEREKLKAIAKKYNKYISGGTDYHANNKPNIALATGINNNMNLDKDFISAWIDKVKTI